MSQPTFPTMVEPARLAVVQLEQEIENTKNTLKEKKRLLKDAVAIWQRVSGETKEPKPRKSKTEPTTTPQAPAVTKGARS